MAEQPPTKTGPQAQKTAVQQGGLAQSMPQDTQGEDPEFQRRKQGWDQVLAEMSTKPGAASFLMSMGSQLMQPVEPDTGLVGNIGQAADRSQQMQQQLQQQQFQQGMAEEEQALQEQRVEQRRDLAEQRMEQEREMQDERFQFKEEDREDRQEFKLKVLDEEFQNEMSLAMNEAMAEAEETNQIDRQKLYTEVWDKVYKQAKADRLNLSEEGFQKKWGDNVQDDILASYRSAIKHIGGQRTGEGQEKKIDEKVTVSGEFMQRAAEEQGVDPGQFEPGRQYKLDPERYQELAGQPDEAGDPAPPTTEGQQEQQEGQEQAGPEPQEEIQIGERTIQDETAQTKSLGELIGEGYQSVSEFVQSTGSQGLATEFRRQLRGGSIRLPSEAIQEAMPSLSDAEKEAARKILQNRGVETQQQEQQ